MAKFLSISDDDLCATCVYVRYNPGGESSCKKNWPCIWDKDGYSAQCSKYVECPQDANWVGVGT